MRGEYYPSTASRTHSTELPPRARRILELCNNFQPFSGTTSACAENTLLRRFRRRLSGNYLRVRGEYEGRVWGGSTSGELPPRARRIPGRRLFQHPPFGTTSACAENTFGGGVVVVVRWNYLRVRGEYHTHSNPPSVSVELPPRARRIPFNIEAGHVPQGTTSACAENTEAAGFEWGKRWNYLRVRGEY